VHGPPSCMVQTGHPHRTICGAWRATFSGIVPNVIRARSAPRLVCEPRRRYYAYGPFAQVRFPRRTSCTRPASPRGVPALRCDPAPRCAAPYCGVAGRAARCSRPVSRLLRHRAPDPWSYPRSRF
jgi:hypothetical protein